ncbi:hypothetical protein SAMN05518672_106221 [Chitinophaga sp. CF118]|nr:hypothetical protein SAMN05518672_106221 [Chitinophaga sp. CF118]
MWLVNYVVCIHLCFYISFFPDFLELSKYNKFAEQLFKDLIKFKIFSALKLTLNYKTR